MSIRVGLRGVSCAILPEGEARFRGSFSLARISVLCLWMSPGFHWCWSLHFHLLQRHLRNHLHCRRPRHLVDFIMYKSRVSNGFISSDKVMGLTYGVWSLLRLLPI